MKKFFKSLVAVMLVAMMAISFTSCGGVNKDPVKAAENLEANGYTVISLHDDGSLIGGTASQAAIAAAVAIFDVKAENVDYVVTGSKGDESIAIYYCKDADTATKIYDFAKKAQDDAKAEIEKMKEEAKSLEGDEKAQAEEAIKEAEEELKDVSFGKSGKIVWLGTKAGAKATK